MLQINLNSLSDVELKDLAEALHVLDERHKYNKQEFLWPQYQKPGYDKHLLFFSVGKLYKERALIAGNRTGKTYLASTEMSYHLNGRYPEVWEGKKFSKPIEAWSVGKTHDTTREILQKYLIGNRYDVGTGMIPKEDIVRVTSKPGCQDAIQDVYVKHYTEGVYDGLSHCEFKSYVQGVDSFMGATMDVIHLDEEPTSPQIYGECLLRTMTTKGIIFCTFTPKLGLTDTVLSFLPGGKFPAGGCGPVGDAR